MANTLLSVLRNSSFNYFKVFNNLPILTQTKNIRCLYAKSSLGVDGFEQTRDQIKSQMASVADKFKEKMFEYSEEDSKNMIFTEDLKNMIHLADTNKDIEVVVNMMKKYNTQNKSLRFGNYVFGPVVMRMFYTHNKADLAFECFKSAELSSIFDQNITYQILCDILYENKKYEQVLEAVKIIKEKQMEGLVYPKNVIVLAFAACYKMNTEQSLEYALNLWRELGEVGHQPLRRAITFCAALAINQGKYEIALEILSSTRHAGYTTVRNLKVLALSQIGRVEDVIPILKNVLHIDSPNGQLHTFNRDVLEKVKEAVDSSDNHEVIIEFTRLMELFQKQGCISEMTLEDQLCAEIQQIYPHRNNQIIPTTFAPRRPQRSFHKVQERPGLSDLV